jgi:hypothetical protein
MEYTKLKIIHFKIMHIFQLFRFYILVTVVWNHYGRLFFYTASRLSIYTDFIYAFFGMLRLSN